MSKQPPTRRIVAANACVRFNKWHAELDCGHKVVLDKNVDPPSQTKETICYECVRKIEQPA